MSTPEQRPDPIPQACVIPFRRRGERVEFCLITSLKRQRWIFPKGIIDPGETEQEAALKEALEEAGLRGRILGAPLGSYQDAKWGTTLTVTVLLMEVTSCEEHWDEAHLRQRCWVEAAAATEMLSRRELREFTEVAVRRIAAI